MKSITRVCVLVVVGQLTVFVSAKDGSILHFAPKRGSVYKYNLTVRMTVQGSAYLISGVSKHKVTNVDSNGLVHSASSQGAATVTVNGSKVKTPLTGDDVQTTVNRPDGTVVSVGGKDTSPSRWRRETVQTIKLPNVPLAIGTSWTWLSNPNSKTGAVKSKGQYKVLGSEVIHGIPTWKIAATVKELTGAVQASMTGYEWISKVDATPVRCRLKEKNMPVGGIPPRTVVNISVDLIR